MDIKKFLVGVRKNPVLIMNLVVIPKTSSQSGHVSFETSSALKGRVLFHISPTIAEVSFQGVGTFRVEGDYQDDIALFTRNKTQLQQIAFDQHLAELSQAIL